MKSLVIGTFFVLFNFEISIGIGKLGLIPAFVGCFFLWQGCMQLAQESSHFEDMRKPALCLTVYFVITYVLALFGLGANIFTVVLAIIDIVAAIATLYVVYNIVSGLSATERRRAVDLGARKVSNWFNYMVAAQLALLFGFLIVFLLLILAIVSAVCSIAFFVVFYKCYRETQLLVPPLGMEEKAGI